ncbi:MAG: FN3 associated domain-containing protein, partial [Melioribacteraceae bacterium]|nr:FN3 associated domain-containing protein [Melioribacteraceae bacterium]
FTFDITDQLNESEFQEILLRVWDPVDEGKQPRGKQVSDPGGIWYTPVTGIWQTVWIEPVSNEYINDIKITPDIDNEKVRISADVEALSDNLNLKVRIIKSDSNIVEQTFEVNEPIELSIQNSILWSPENPFLYDLELSLIKDDMEIDKLKSYFGMRKISLGKEKGISKLYLNNEFYFQFGPLDQGWWPDGLYTAATDDALKYDVEVTKKLGFNMARKHVKVEPARWYYWCDKLGLLVWQDMPSGDEYIDPNEPDLIRTEESAEQFELEWSEIIRQFYNSPSIVIWVPFNEGWGQFDTERIVEFTKEIDPTRLVINTSGWADRGVGDIHDIHAYPGPAMPDPESDRAIVLGEFGGLGLPLEGHTWQSSDNWGYRSYTNKSELTSAYTDLIRKLQGFIGRGLSAAVYTQTSDVEVEVNGLMTYDRKVIKMDDEALHKINHGFLPPIFKSNSNIFLNSLSIEIENELQKGEIYYTLDGSDPNTKSNLYSEPIIIKNSVTIKARTYWDDGSFSTAAAKSYSKVDIFKSLEGDFKPGIKFSFYDEGIPNFTELPNFDSLMPTNEGITDIVDLSKSNKESLFTLKFEGFINLPDDGIYTFYSNSDDGSQIFINNKLVVDNDFMHGMTEKSGEIALAKGFHSFKVTFFQGEGGKGLEISVRGPDLDKQVISSKYLFH